jgi:hypothetical protein
LVAGESVDIFLDGGATPIGSATIATGSTDWTWTQPTALSIATHSYIAKIKSNGVYVSSSSAFNIVVASTPLVLDLNGDGVQTVDAAQGVQFDLMDTGTKQTVGWVSKHDGLLAIDLNGDGQINSGAELFGDHMRLADGSLAQDGWSALAALDNNGDAVIDAQDAAFSQLRVWVDANGNGSTDAGELRTLAEMHIANISLQADTHSVQQNGNVVQAFSSYTTTEGATHEIADVGFKVQASGSGLFTLHNGESLDLSAVTTANQNGQITQVDMSSDQAANTVTLSLADVLSTPLSNGMHTLTLTGDANDSVAMNLADWVSAGTTVSNAGNTYAVYHAASDLTAQLLIDLNMVNANHVG